MMIKKIKVIVTVLVVTLCSSVFAADFVAVPRPDAFRGFLWGTALEEMPELQVVVLNKRQKVFFRPSEKLSFGEASIISVAYSFRKDKFYRVGIAYEGRVNQFLLKERLISLYGPGRSVGDRYGWMWPDFSIELNYDDATDKGGLIYTYEGPLE